jgi:16S rRNA (guanine966-N2)-methyltransferase
LRETLFNVLAGGKPAVLEGTLWLDLYAGTGAVGIEALSRGARLVCFVESSARAANLIRRNLQSLELEGSAFRVMQEDAVRALRKYSDAPDFIFLDPPYRMEAAYERTLKTLAECKSLKPTTTVIVEHEKKFDPGEKFGMLTRYRKLVQGDASLSFYRIV